MSITTTTNRVQEQGNGVKVEFDFTYPVDLITDLEVYKVDRLTGQASLMDYTTELLLPNDYTVELFPIGGRVTYMEAPTEEQDSLIYRKVPLTQTTNIPSQNIFREEQITNALDRLMMAIQQLSERID